MVLYSLDSGFTTHESFSVEEIRFPDQKRRKSRRWESACSLTAESGKYEGVAWRHARGERWACVHTAGSCQAFKVTGRTTAFFLQWTLTLRPCSVRRGAESIMARRMFLLLILAALPAASTLNVDKEDNYSTVVPDFRGMSEDEVYIAQELWRTAQETENARKVLQTLACRFSLGSTQKLCLRSSRHRSPSLKKSLRRCFRGLTGNERAGLSKSRRDRQLELLRPLATRISGMVDELSSRWCLVRP